MLRDLPASFAPAGAGAVLLLAELENIIRGFEKAGVEAMAMKGAALIAGNLRSPLERGLTDIDLLVRPRQLAAARSVLRAGGFKPMGDSALAFIKDCGPEGELLAPVIADLHFWLDYRRDTEAVFTGARRVRLGAVSLLIPADEEHVLLLCAHGILHHACLPRTAFDDVSVLCGADGFSWDVLAAAARQTGATVLLHAAFAEFSRRGMGVPEQFLQASRPRGIADRVRLRFFSRACGVDPAGTLLEYMLPPLYSPRNIVRYWGGGGLFGKPARVFRNMICRMLRRKGI